MSVSLIVLAVVALLVLLGVAQRVLDRMYLTDRQALVIVALLIVGTLIPNIRLGMVEISIGGALIPLGLCVYLLVKAGTVKERVRALAGAVITAAAVFLLGRLMPNEPEQIWLDPNYAYGLAGGVIAYLLGRSRRGAFICGVLGVLLADIAVGIVNSANGISQTLVLGGAGVLDAALISGLIAVLLCELVGEIIERMARGNTPPEHSPIKTPASHRGGEKK